MRIELIDFSNLLQTDFELTIREQYHEESEPLRDELVGRILDRTPQLTGALRKDETGRFNASNLSNPMLVEMYTEKDDQLVTWKRIYAQFVEGGKLGDPSPTIRRPARMYWRTTEEDLNYIEDWAGDVMDHVADRITDGRGAKL